MENTLPPASPPPVLPVPAPAPTPGPAPRRRSPWLFVGLAVAAGLILMLVFSSVSVLNFSAKRAPQSGQRLHEVLVEDNGSDHKIVIVDVQGIITSQPWNRGGDNLVDVIEDQLKLASEDKSIRAIILKVDSPGGEVMASDDISRAILDFQKQTGKPVVASMGGLAASGGYYVSVPCEWIVANELTITGSIGVIMNSFNYRGLLDKIGVRPEVFKSGRFKDMLRGSKKPEEITPEEREMIQALIDETFAKFKGVVAEGRKRAYAEHQGKGARALSQDWQEFADGRILTGKQAWELGFVDELGNFETAVKRARILAGLPRANLVRYVKPIDLSQLFRLLGRKESTVKVDWGMDLPKLEAGRLYFLSPTVLH